MEETNGWQSDAKCLSLSPGEADRLFFPGSGGKPHKADSYCATCPVLSNCLLEAIELKLPGFMAGTTIDQRNEMARFQAIVQRELEMPPEPDRKKRTIYLKIVIPSDHHEWMDQVEPSDNEIVALDQGVA